MTKFIIAGLPRSGTTWLSVFLTTDSCVCLHDPIATHTPEELSVWEGGISDTGVWLYTDWCRDNTDKFIIVDRKIEQVNKQLSQKGLPEVDSVLYSRFLDAKKEADEIIYFENLFLEDTCEWLWSFVHSETPFNKKRWEQLKDIYISPIMWEELNDNK